jgi:ribosomal protein S18 acetylase RimI-like enzyme
MTLELRPMSADRLASWTIRVLQDYEESRRALGRSHKAAAAETQHAAASMFPGGLPAPGHLVHDVVQTDAGAEMVVGLLWVAPREPESNLWWVYDIEIDEMHRGQGHGRTVMELAEEVALAHGATTLGLNVAGRNAAARRLYEAVGYEVLTQEMRKTLIRPA